MDPAIPLPTRPTQRAAARRDYSGRFMYGETCPGFDVEDVSAATALAVAAGTVLGEECAMDLAHHSRTDQMGLGIIVYFPGVNVE